MANYFAGRAWAYQRARDVLSNAFRTELERPRPLLTAQDFAPAVLDPRLAVDYAGTADLSDGLGPDDEFPGGVLPRGFQLRDLNPAGDMEVVGELSYWPTLAKFREDYGKNVVAILEPLREGEHLSVRVSLLSGERYYHIGFLPSAEATDYYAVIDRLTRNNQIGLCPARIWWPEGKADQMIQVYLKLAPASSLLPEAAPSSAYYNITGFTTVVVTKEEEHQQALDFFGAQEKLWFHLGFCTIQSGKYAGEQTIQVRLEDHIVGELTHFMGQRYRGLVQAGQDRGQQVICQGRIRDEAERGLQVELFLPSADVSSADGGYDSKE